MQRLDVCLSSSAVQCTAMQCTSLHCSALHCTELHCTALHLALIQYEPLAAHFQPQYLLCLIWRQITVQCNVRQTSQESKILWRGLYSCVGLFLFFKDNMFTSFNAIISYLLSRWWILKNNLFGHREEDIPVFQNSSRLKKCWLGLKYWLEANIITKP